MPSLLPGYEYDIFISYRHKDNGYDGWVTEFVANLRKELHATLKDDVSIYIDENKHDGILETHNVDESLAGKIKCLIFIPILSQTYCDPKSFAWNNEFLAFNKMANEDSIGPIVKLANGNAANRVLPVKIHELDAEDTTLLEREIGGKPRSVDFIYRSPGVNRPLKSNDDRAENSNQYRNQLNKVANSIKELLAGMLNMTDGPRSQSRVVEHDRPLASHDVWQEKKKRTFVVLSIAIFLVIAIPLFVYVEFVRPSVGASGSIDKSVVVLPFDNFTGDINQEYFCDGMMDEILNHLSKISDLHVTSRTSSMQYKSKKISGVEFARSLGVGYFLEGSLRKSGDRIRITVQLIDVRTDKHVWSEDYDYRNLKDIFALQTDVSTKIAHILQAKLTVRETGTLSKYYTTNVQAYKYYQKGRMFWDQRTVASYDSAEANYKHAVELDPSYALAYVGLADCYTFNVKGMAQTEAIPVAKAYLSKALSLDSSLSEGWATAGFIRSHYEYDWEGSKKILKKAIRLNPNYPISYLYYGNVLFATGDTEQAIAETKTALKLDPLSSTLNWVLGRNYYHMGKFDLAIEQLRHAIRINPRYPFASEYLGLSLLLDKKNKEAYEVIGRLPATQFGTGEDKKALLTFADAMSGSTKKAKEELNECLQLSRISPYWIAINYIALRDFDKAMIYFEKGYEKRAIQMIHLKVNPATSPIRNDPRFKALLEKMNLD